MVKKLDHDVKHGKHWYDRMDSRIIRGIMKTKLFFGLGEAPKDAWKGGCEYCGGAHKTLNGWKTCHRKHFKCFGCGKRHKTYKAYEKCMMNKIKCPFCNKGHRTEMGWMNCRKAPKMGGVDLTNYPVPNQPPTGNIPWFQGPVPTGGIQGVGEMHAYPRNEEIPKPKGRGGAKRKKRGGQPVPAGMTMTSKGVRSGMKPRQYPLAEVMRLRRGGMSKLDAERKLNWSKLIS